MKDLIIFWLIGIVTIITAPLWWPASVGEDVYRAWEKSKY